MAEEKSPLLGRLDVNSFASHAAFVARRCRLSAVRAGRPELRVFDSDPDLAAAPQDLLLFIHGSCGSLEQFRAQLAHFSASYHVVSYDALGCGASPKPDDAPAYAKAQLLADGLAVLDEHVKRRSKKGYVRRRKRTTPIAHAHRSCTCATVSRGLSLLRSLLSLSLSLSLLLASLPLPPVTAAARSLPLMLS